MKKRKKYKPIKRPGKTFSYCPNGHKVFKLPGSFAKCTICGK